MRLCFMSYSRQASRNFHDLQQAPYMQGGTRHQCTRAKIPGLAGGDGLAARLLFCAQSPQFFQAAWYPDAAFVPAFPSDSGQQAFAPPREARREHPGLRKARNTPPQQKPGRRAVSSPVMRIFRNASMRQAFSPVKVSRQRPGRELLPASDSTPPCR